MSMCSESSASAFSFDDGCSFYSPDLHRPRSAAVRHGNCSGLETISNGLLQLLKLFQILQQILASGQNHEQQRRNVESGC